MIINLSPNTQYIIYVTAITEKGASMPSETLIAWTDPAYPAFVEVGAFMFERCVAIGRSCSLPLSIQLTWSLKVAA